MTDRFASLVVVLEHEGTKEDIRSIVDAIAMVKGVAEVNYGVVVEGEFYVARRMALHCIRRKLWDLLWEEDME